MQCFDWGNNSCWFDTSFTAVAACAAWDIQSFQTYLAGYPDGSGLGILRDFVVAFVEKAQYSRLIFEQEDKLQEIKHSLSERRENLRRLLHTTWPDRNFDGGFAYLWVLFCHTELQTIKG